MAQTSTLSMVFIFKNFSKILNNHPYVIGLGIAAYNNAKTLGEHGIKNDMWGIVEADEIDKRLEIEQQNGNPLPNFVIISALWIPTIQLARLCHKYKDVNFVVNIHSNVSFLYADRSAFRLIREAVELQKLVPNFNLAGNSYKFSSWASIAFGIPVAFLPNLYNLNGIREWENRQKDDSQIIKIGSFGANRILKGHLTACAAAIEISRKLDIPVEFWLSAGRMDGGYSIIQSIEQLTRNMPNVQLRYKQWAPWEEFRNFIGTMDINIQVSMSESFNMVLADSSYMAVPGIGSEVIEWYPDSCIANLDDANEVADLGIDILQRPSVYVEKEQKALKKYVKNGIKSWKAFLTNKVE